MDSNELCDYIFSVRRKKFYQYSPSYYWAHIKRLIDYIVNRPLCFFGWHRAYDGLFHTRIDRFGDKDGYKCYHCRYCNKPADQKLCDEQVHE